MSEYPFSWKIPPTSSRYWRLFLRNAATTQIYTLSLHDALPISYEVPLAEGNAWLPYRPMLAVTAWREALRRAGPLRPEVYASMLSDASLTSAEVSPILEEIGLGEHDLALPYLRRVSDASFNRALAQLL